MQPQTSDNFLGDTGLYFVVKIFTSLDDLIWLSPFLAISGDDIHDERSKVCTIYITISLLISFGAVLLAWLANTGLVLLLSKHGEYDAEKVGRFLDIVGGICIATFAFLEWRNGGDDDSEENNYDEEVENGSSPNNETSPLVEHSGIRSSHTDRGENVIENDEEIGGGRQERITTAADRRHVLIDLSVVGFCGQLDTLAVFCSVLVTRPKLRMIPIVFGSLAAAILIFMLAYFITLFRPLTACLQRVPLWMLLGTIAIYITLQGIVHF